MEQFSEHRFTSSIFYGTIPSRSHQNSLESMPKKLLRANIYFCLNEQFRYYDIESLPSIQDPFFSCLLDVKRQQGPFFLEANLTILLCLF